MTKPPKPFKPRSFKDHKAALAAIGEIYDAHVDFLRQGFVDFSCGTLPPRRTSVFYPYIKMKTDNASRVDTRLSYGFVSRPGTYFTTVTQPHLYDHYLMEQMRLLLLNHGSPLEVGVSN